MGLKHKKAVIFDLDGTLVDSMWMWKAIDVEFLARYGYECPEDLQKAIEGMSFSETAAYFKERFKIPDSLEEIKAAWTEMSIEKYRSQVPLKPGARDFLDRTAHLGMKAGIATSNGRAMVDAVLDSLGIRRYFQVVATACEVAAGKPAPDIYLAACASIQMDPGDCIALEDSPAGVTSAYRAGLHPVMIPDLQQPDETVQSMLYARLDSLDQAIALLEKDRAAGK